MKIMKKKYSFIIAAALAVASCSSAPSFSDYSSYIDDCVRTELATLDYIYDGANGSVEENAILLGSVLNSLGYPAFAELGATKVNYSYNLGPTVANYHDKLGLSYAEGFSRFPYSTSPYKLNAGKVLSIYEALQVNLEGISQTKSSSKEAEWTFTESNSGVSFVFSVKNPGSSSQELNFKAEETSLQNYINSLK